MSRLVKRFNSRLARSVISFPKKHRRLKAALEAGFVGLPTALFAYANVRWTDLPLPAQDKVRTCLLEHQVLLVGVLCWPILGSIILSILADWVKGLADGNGICEEELVALITAIDDLEGKKMNRFAEFARDVERDPAKTPAAFLTITRPDKQIEYLVTNLHHVLKHAIDDDTLKLVLARIQDNLPVQWRCQMPNDVLLPDDLLADRARNTLFAEAARTRKAQRIGDIEAYLAKNRKPKSLKYVATGDPQQDQGSIICKPLYSPQLGRVLYVLSIKSDNHGVIGPNFERRYGTILKSFCVLLMMEAHLEVIRSYVEV